jgi:tetratricopeptide (TPR) repeat protein
MRNIMVAQSPRFRVLCRSLPRIASICGPSVVVALGVISISLYVGALRPAQATSQATPNGASSLPWPVFAPEPEFFAFGESLLEHVSSAQQRANNGSNQSVVGSFLGLDEIIDFAKFRERATDHLAGPNPELHRQLREQADQALVGPSGLFQEITDNMAQGGSYEFLRISYKRYLDSPRAVAVFRLIRPDGSRFNYHDYVVDWATDDANHRVVKAIDVYSYQHGEDLSRTVRRDIIKKHEQSLRVSTDDPLLEYQRNLTRIEQISNALKKKSDYQRAMDIYNKLPDAVRRDQSLLVMMLRAAANYGRDAFKIAYDAYPGDYKTAADPLEPVAPARELLAIDGFLYYGKNDLALDCVRNLERAVGDNDPYLKAVRAGILLTQGDADEAWKDAKTAIESAQHNGGGLAARTDAFWKLMRATVAASGDKQTERFEATAGVLSKQNLDRSFIKNLSSFPQYDPFTTSKAFARLCR